MNRVKLQLELNAAELAVVREALWNYATLLSHKAVPRSINRLYFAIYDALQYQFNKNSVVRTKPLNVLYIKE